MKRKNKIALFLVVTGLFWFSLYTYVPILATFAESVGASYKIIGLIVGTYGFTQMLLRIPLGIVSDRLNRRKVFVVLGLILGFASSFGMWVFHNPLSLLVFRSMAGAAAAAWVAYTVLFSGYFSHDNAPKAMGYITAVTTIGQASAIFIGGLVSEHMGSTTPFLAGAAGGLAGIALSLGIIEKKDINTKQISFSQLVKVIREPGLLRFSVLAIFIQFITFSTVYGFTPVAAKDLGASDFQLGLITALSTLPTALGAVLSGSVLRKHLGEKLTLLSGFAVAVFCTAVIPFINTLPVMYVTQAAGGFSRGMVFPMLMGLSIMYTDEKRRASAMGFFQAIYGIGMFLGPSICGLIADTLGLPWGFWFAGLTGVAGFIICLSGPKDLNKQTT